jgi:hypothetical protein
MLVYGRLDGRLVSGGPCTGWRMAEVWLTYGELGERLGISPEAARQKAMRGRWRRQQGNDGKARVLVGFETNKTVHMVS